MRDGAHFLTMVNIRHNLGVHRVAHHLVFQIASMGGLLKRDATSKDGCGGSERK
jgi:hypothetical protein